MESATNIHNPEDGMLNFLSFNDLFDLEEIQRIQDLFSDATGVASLITHPDGTPITRPSNFCRLCSDIIRKTEKGLANCYLSDAVIGRQNPSGPAFQPCLSGGLWDGGASITAGGKHVANWLIGQVRNEQQNILQMEKYAEEIGADKADFMEALSEVPKMSVEQFAKVSEMLFVFAGELSEKAYNNLILKREIAERNLLEKSRNESEQKYRLLFMDSPDAYLIITDGVFTDCNHATEVMMRGDRSLFIGKSPDALSPEFQPDGRSSAEAAEEKISLAFAKGQNTFEWVHRRFDGSDFMVEVSIAPFELDGKQVLFTAWRDITNRKKTEDALRETNAYLENLINYANAPIIVWDPDFHITRFNNAFELMTGRTESEMLGKSLELLFPPELLEQSMSLIRKTMTGERWETEEIEILHLNGSRHIVQWNSATLFATDGVTPIATIAQGHDITVRKNTEMALRESEERLQFVMQGSQLGSWDWNLETNEVKRNERWAEMLGYNVNEIGFTVKQWSDVIHPDDRKRAWQSVQDHIDGKTTMHRLEYRMLTKDGHIKWILDQAQAVQRDLDGRVIRMSGTHTDITQRKETEEEIRHKNNELIKLNAEKDKFYSIIAHDLRSPLTGFLGLTGLLKEEALNMTIEEIQSILENLNSSAANLFGLLENLLQWSQMQQGSIPFNPEIVHLNQLVAETIEMVNDSAAKKEIEIAIDIPEGLTVFADKYMLEGIVRNLSSNAVKFTNRGGNVLVSAKATPEKSVEISVADNGIGMSQKILNNLFHLDIKTGRKGTAGEPSTGLGLLLCHEFVEKHKGQIRVESKPEDKSSNEASGSVFYVTLPEEKIQSTGNFKPSGIRSVSEAQQGKNMKILIVEDDEISNQLIVAFFKRHSDKILVAVNGKEAVEICREYPDIDLILMDVKMPVMDGYEATREIRKFNNKVVIIAQTAYGLDGDRAIALGAGCNDYMTKPISQAKLLALTRQQFNNH